ncbi:tubulin polyglutamylase TTLL4-like isoform X2 [Contarinia nasturtii]|nr:tubulin polyglutamylase TTLL4-like isoform X2 [Contarinia nasturtii]
MDTLTSAQVQMPTEQLKLMDDKHDDGQHIFEVDENQENNGLKRQRLSDNNTNSIQMSTIVRTKACANDQTYENHLKTMRCLSTATDSPPPTNGITTTTTTTATSIQLKGAHNTKHSNDVIKSNGFNNHIENNSNNRENGLSIPSDGCDILANLCDGQNEGYFDAMITSDLSDADMKLAMQKEKCTENQIFSNGNDQNGNDHVINKGHRRTRARSSDSIQAEFYQARKQQMRLQSHIDSDLYTNGSDDSQSHCNATAYTTHVSTTRGKSLSPPKVGASKKQTIHSNAYLNRAANQRHIVRPFSILRKQKLISKAKQQAARLSPSTPSPTAMGKSIAKIESPPPKPNDNEKPNETEDKVNSSESEYSSLEDDDDVQEPTDSDENDLTDTEEYVVDNKAIYNSFNDGTEMYSMLADSVQGRSPKMSPLTPSLFAHVPPYITFASHEEKGSMMPAAIKKSLKWKLTTITPIVIRKILLNSGFRLLKQTNDWMGTWGKHMKSPCFRTLKTYQKINHIPGTFQIGRKDKIWRNLQSQMLRNGRKEFNFMPLTYILPQDIKKLKRLWQKFDQRNTKWIIKPPASARGTGIKVVSRWNQIPKRKPIIVQKYIDRPLLINGSKFDLRLYVLVTSLNPLRAYMHTDGLARFASVKYSNDIDTLGDRYMHLTNYSINKLSSNYAKNEDAESCSGHKWTLKTLWKYFSAQGINTDGLWAALRNLVLRTILSGEHVINQMSKANVGSRYNTFELFGIDVILDSELKPWLLEVNISPSLHSSSPLDLHVKGPLVTALLNTVRFNVPPRFNHSQQAELMAELGLQGHNLCYDRRLHVVNLSKTERFKHNQYTSKAIANREQYLEPILENLTPDDIRCLIASEDELARCAPLERVCPTPNSHRYIKFTEKPRYYNRLLDAWEHRYSNKRDEGIELLRKFCENRIHLIIPIPCSKLNAKKNVEFVENSENEIDEVFDASMKATAQKRTDHVDTDTIESTTAKIIDECKSPLPMPDDQINESVIDQHADILVSSKA